MNFINKHFRKGKCVLAIFLSEDRRVRFKYVIPKGNNVTIGSYSYIINEDDLFLHKGMPAFILTTKNAEPIKVNPLNKKTSYLSAEEYNTAISNQVAKQIFLANKGGFDGNILTLILLGVLLMGLIVIGYLGSQYITEINERIINLENLLRAIGGI